MKYPLIREQLNKIEEKYPQALDFLRLYSNLIEKNDSILLANPRDPLVKAIAKIANQGEKIEWLDNCFQGKKNDISLINDVFYAALTALSLNKISIETMESIMLYRSILIEFPDASLFDLNDLTSDIMDLLYTNPASVFENTPRNQQFFIKIELTPELIAEWLYVLFSKFKNISKNQDRIKQCIPTMTILIRSIELVAEDQHWLEELIEKEKWALHDLQSFLTFLHETFPNLKQSNVEKLPSLIPILQPRKCGMSLLNDSDDNPILIISSPIAFKKSLETLFDTNEYYLKSAPVFGNLTAENIAQFELLGYRPIQYPHPNFPCPDEADGHAVIWEFMFLVHDLYHVGITSFIPHSHADFFCKLALFLERDPISNKLKNKAEKLIDLEMQFYLGHQNKLFEIQNAFLSVLSYFLNKYPDFSKNLEDFLNQKPNCNQKVLILAKKHLLVHNKMNNERELSNPDTIKRVMNILSFSRQSSLLRPAYLVSSFEDVTDASDDFTQAPLSSCKSLPDLHEPERSPELKRKAK